MATRSTITIPSLFLAVLASLACNGFNMTTLDSEELQAYALERYAEGEYRDAQVAFSRLATAYPGYAADPSTRLYMAHSHYALSEFVLAAAEYKRVSTSFPRASEAVEASVGVCRSYVALAPDAQRDQKFTDEAITSCLQTRQAYVGTQAGAEADSLYAVVRNRRAEHEFVVGEYYFKEDYAAASEVYYLTVVNRYPDTDWAPESLLRLHQVYTLMGDAWAEEAAAMRQRLLTQYPDSRAARAAENGG